MKLKSNIQEKCISCGKFMKYEKGASWAQSWSYDMSGEPNLHEPKWHCKLCTEKYGRIIGNCSPGYDGIIR